MTHIRDIRDPSKVLCRSGAGRAKSGQVLTVTGAKHATCYRCAKLGALNMAAGRSAGDPG